MSKSCPTCGTPTHNDKIRPETLSAGAAAVRKFFPDYDWRACKALAENVFREMMKGEHDVH